MTRVMGIVGFKESGKTSLIERLTQELDRRGFEVGVIKHTTTPCSLDTPGKDTWRYSQTGAKTSAILTPKETAIFLHQLDELDMITKILESLDLVFLEGFKELDRIPRIILASDKSEVQKLIKGLEVAIARATEKEVHNKLENNILKAFNDVYNVMKKHETDMRSAALILSIGRIANSVKSLGLWP